MKFSKGDRVRLIHGVPGTTHPEPGLIGTIIDCQHHHLGDQIVSVIFDRCQCIFLKQNGICDRYWGEAIDKYLEPEVLEHPIGNRWGHLQTEEL